MNESFTKALSELLVALMAFFGWQTADYANILPPPLEKEIVSTTTPDIISETKKPEVPIAAKPKPAPQKPALPKVMTQPVKPAPLPSPKPQPTVILETPPAPIKEVPAVEEKKLTDEEKIQKATVNIYCSMRSGNFIQKATGSGVIIDSKGVILTNAHVAQHVLLSQHDSSRSCSIRTGSPAKESYKAKVVFLPSEWIKANRNNLKEAAPQGTGEYDYALLVITEVTSKSAKNIPLPYFDLYNGSPDAGDSIILSGYPAGFGSVSVLDSALYHVYKNSKAVQILGFNGRNKDVFITSPTPLAESGASGGPMIFGGKVAGLIDSTVLDYTGQKTIQGITSDYILRSIKATSGKTLADMLKNPYAEADNFARDEISELAGILLGN